MRPYQRNKIFFEQGNIAEGSGRRGRATVIVPWRAAILAAVPPATGGIPAPG